MKRSLITLILGLSFATSWALAQDRSETSDSDVTPTVKQSGEASETLAQPARDDLDFAAETEVEENKKRGGRRARSLNREAEQLLRQPRRLAPQRNRRSRVQDEFEYRERRDGDPSEQVDADENAARRDIEAEVKAAISEMEEFRQGMQRESHDQIRAFENEMRELEAARAEAELDFQTQQIEFQKRMQELQRAHTEAEAAARERERAVHARMLQLQNKLHPRREDPFRARDRHRTATIRPRHTRNPQARIHSELQDAVRQLRDEIAELRDEVAELSERVDEP